MSAPINAILQDRKITHGDFTDHARVTQSIKRIMEAQFSWSELNDCQREALAMFAHKIGRILVGNPNHNDHWDDIAGYAKLVSDRIDTLKPPVVREAQHGEFTDQTPVKTKYDPPCEGKTGTEWERLQNNSPGHPLDAMWPDDEPGTPEDGGHHASAAERLEDGLQLRGLPGDFDLRPYMTVVDPISKVVFAIVVRRHGTDWDWSHLPRLPLELNYQEWKEQPAEYRALYFQHGDKYIMNSSYVEHWGKQL